MSTEHLARHVLVDSRLVGQEVLIHIENRLQRTGFHQFSLNGINAVKNNEDLLEEVLVLRVLHRVPLLALSGAFGSGLELAALGVEIAQSVMLALGEGVGVAPVLGTIRATSAHALVHERVPGLNGIATLATLATVLAAAQDIQGRKTILHLSLRSNAPTIRGSSSSTHSPTRAADGLIAYLLNGGALRPVRSSIELLGEVSAQHRLLDRNVSSLQSTDELSEVTGRNGFVSHPGGVHSVHLLGDLHKSRRVRQSQGKQSNDDKRSHVCLRKELWLKRHSSVVTLPNQPCIGETCASDRAFRRRKR